VSVIVTTIWTYTTRPVFTATATLRIEKDEPRVLKFEEVVKADAQQDYYQTQFKILQSRTLANRVIGLLALDQHAEFQRPEQDDGWVATLRPGPGSASCSGCRCRRPSRRGQRGSRARVADDPVLRGRLTVEPVRNARLVKVAFESHYPDLAARVANTLAEAFIARISTRRSRPLATPLSSWPSRWRRRGPSSRPRR
jgi:uncharacterized protein involved in exopolysaccharide biosynthesis